MIAHVRVLFSVVYYRFFRGNTQDACQRVFKPNGYMGVCEL